MAIKKDRSGMYGGAIDKDAKESGTQATEDSNSSIVDVILSTCCCGGSTVGQKNSLVEKDMNNQQQDPADVEESPKFWERLGDVALVLLGAAPPVKFVRCFECSSVDESELSIPRVLTDMAEEYDKTNKSKVFSMCSISEDATEGADLGYFTESDEEIDLLFTKSSLTKSRSGGRWGKIGRSTSSRSSRSTRSGISASYSGDPYLSIVNMDGGAATWKPMKGGAANVKPERGVVLKHKIRRPSWSKSGRSRSGKSVSSKKSKRPLKIEV